MTVYTFVKDYNNPWVEVGEKVEAECGTEVKVMSIIKVDFTEDKIWFTGVPTYRLD